MPFMLNFIPALSDNKACCMAIQNKLFLGHIFHSTLIFSINFPLRTLTQKQS